MGRLASVVLAWCGGGVRRPYKYLLDQYGTPYPCEDQEHWHRNFPRQRAYLLTRIDLPEGGDVSTVFLGRDLNLHFEGPPVLWETMVLGGAFDGMQRRWETQREARKGHQWMCCHMTTALTAAMQPEPQGGQ